MQFDYTIDSEAGAIYGSYHGLVELQTLRDDVDRLQGDPQFNSHFDMMLDFRDATLSLSYDDVLLLLPMFKEKGLAPMGRLAVIPGKPVNLGISRMYEQVAQPVHRGIKIFESTDEARQWLEGNR